MIGTSDGRQFNSELDYLFGNELKQEDNSGPVTKDNAVASRTETGQNYDESARRMMEHQREQHSQDAPQEPTEARTAVIIRHGDTHYTEDDKAHGWSQEGLTDKGAQEVWKYADLKDKPDMLVTSDLPRTQETASIVSEKTGIPIVEQHQGLRTWDIGSLQGKPCKEADEQLKGYVNNPDKPVPGGESFNEFKSRVLGSVHDVMSRFPDQKVGLVTHSKVQKLLDAYDSTDGQYVDHDHFNEAAESPGKEKTMKLAMNDRPPLSMDVLGSQMQFSGGAHAGVGRVMPAANKNVLLEERIPDIIQKSNKGNRLEFNEIRDLRDFRDKYGGDPLQIESGEPDFKSGPFENKNMLTVRPDPTRGVTEIYPNDDERFMNAAKSWMGAQEFNSKDTPSTADQLRDLFSKK